MNLSKLRVTEAKPLARARQFLNIAFAQFKYRTIPHASETLTGLSSKKITTAADKKHPDTEVRRYVGGQAWSGKKARYRFRSQYLGKPSRTYGLWATVLRHQQKYVGCCGLPSKERPPTLPTILPGPIGEAVWRRMWTRAMPHRYRFWRSSASAWLGERKLQRAAECCCGMNFRLRIERKSEGARKMPA
jgi:hypothetical protein